MATETYKVTNAGSRECLLGAISDIGIHPQPRRYKVTLLRTDDSGLKAEAWLRIRSVEATDNTGVNWEVTGITGSVLVSGDARLIALEGAPFTAKINTKTRNGELIIRPVL